MILYSFLGITTLQMGSAVLAAMFVTLGLLVAISNLLDFPLEFGTRYILVIVMIALLIVAGLMMFISAYKENDNLCLISILLVVIILIVFVVASIVSFANLAKREVCVSRHHCPESLWLSSLNYMKMSKSKNESSDLNEGENNSTPANSMTANSTAANSTAANSTAGNNFDGEYKIDKTAERSLIIVKRSVFSHINYIKGEIFLKQRYPRQAEGDVKPDTGDGMNATHSTSNVNVMDESGDENEDVRYDDSSNEDHPEEGSDKKDGEEYVFGYDFVLAIILFIIIAIFLIYTIILLWSYKSVLKYIEIYSEDPCSKIYVLERFHSE